MALTTSEQNGKEGKPNEKQVDLVQALRKQKRTQRLHRRIVMLCVLLAFLLYFTGVFSALLSVGKTWYETVSISVATQNGYPSQTGISNIDQAEPLTGGFIALGKEGCVVYSSGGNRLRSIQSGYLRPAIAVGGSRYLLYQRAGTELRVESRTETLYTKTFSNNILLASIAEHGGIAVVTESARYLANLTVYSSSLQEKISYSMTDHEGIPLRMEYAPDGKTLALATISASGGQMLARVGVLSVREGTVQWIDQHNATPLAIEWVSKTQMLVFYDDAVMLYDALEGESIASYTYGGKALLDYAVEEGEVALLFAQSARSEAVLLAADLTKKEAFTTDEKANQIAMDAERVYLVYEKRVESYSHTGEWIDCAESAEKILCFLSGRNFFLFTADTVDLFTPPALPQS